MNVLLLPEARMTAVPQSNRLPAADLVLPAVILYRAREIQIKMAQGAKPGEGGHLPAKKVYPWIAKTQTFHTGC